MTIGVGYLGPDWVVLGSDMELTGVAKYKGVKDYFKWFDGQKGVLAAVYAGVEDDMRCVWEELKNRMEAKENSGEMLGSADVRVILAESLSSVIVDAASEFQMLVAITAREKPASFLRVLGKRVSPATSWEVIGRGDCELSRYLMDCMKVGLTKQQASLWATHIISTAISYVQGVGQGIRLSVVQDGRVERVGANLFSQYLAEMDGYVAGLWFELCNLDTSPNTFSERLQAFTTAISKVRDKIPNF
ncbi:MAG: hypothetical protein ACLP1Y_08370 [Candidatus Acidiferrales bacterium]